MVRAVIQEDCTEVRSLVRSNLPHLGITPLRILTQSHVLLHKAGLSSFYNYHVVLRPSIFLALQTIVASGILNLVARL